MKYLRLLSRLEGACLLMSEDKLRLITEKVTLPMYFGEGEKIDRLPINSLVGERKTTNASLPTKVGIIEVFDSLVSKSTSAASGMTSYQSIAAQIDMAVEAGYSHLVFNIDSPGGEASGLFSLTDKIRKLSSQGIKTIGFTDGMATSAAYGILAACSETYATETSILGSIAVIMVHVDTSERDKAEGKTYTIFRSKTEKALGDSHSPLTKTASSKLQSLLDTMDTAFNNDISTSRGLSVDSIKGMNGSEYMAGAALELNLVDKIVSGLDETLSLALKTTQPLKGGRMTLEEYEVMVASLTADKIALQASVNDLSGNLKAAEAALASGIDSAALTTALEKQKAEFVTLLSTAPTLRMDAETVSSILAESPTIASALTTMKHVAKFSAQVITGTSGLQSTVYISAEDKESEDKITSAISAYRKATGVN